MTNPAQASSSKLQLLETPPLTRRGGGTEKIMGAESRSVRTITNRKFRVALDYFNSAIKNDKSLAEAYYWKGKSLEYEGEIEKAYMSYVIAA